MNKIDKLEIQMLQADIAIILSQIGEDVVPKGLDTKYDADTLAICLSHLQMVKKSLNPKVKTKPKKQWRLKN